MPISDSLTRSEFIALDPSLSLIHANELIVPEGDGWRYRINPGDPTDFVIYDTADDAAYARYEAMHPSPDPNAELERMREDPTSPNWIRNIIDTLLCADIVDTTNGLELLYGAFRRRLDAVHGTHQDAEARPLIDAKLAVADEVLANRGEIERALGVEPTELQGLRAILDALDDWHTASIATVADINRGTAHDEALALNREGA